MGVAVPSLRAPTQNRRVSRCSEMGSKDGRVLSIVAGCAAVVVFSVMYFSSSSADTSRTATGSGYGEWEPARTLAEARRRALLKLGCSSRYCRARGGRSRSVYSTSSGSSTSSVFSRGSRGSRGSASSAKTQRCVIRCVSSTGSAGSGACDPIAVEVGGEEDLGDGWELVDVPGDGDCFLHAVFGASKHVVSRTSREERSASLGPVFAMFADMCAGARSKGDERALALQRAPEAEEVEDTDRFTTSARRALAEYIASDPAERAAYTRTFDHLHALSDEDRAAVMAELPTWTVHAVQTSSDSGAFLDECVRCIASRGCWFAQLEVLAFKRMVWGRYGVRIDISVASATAHTRPDAATVDAASTIVLLNTGGGAHYVFLAQKSMM